jgi:hypothetical protein
LIRAKIRANKGLLLTPSFQHETFFKVSILEQKTSTVTNKSYVLVSPCL